LTGHYIFSYQEDEKLCSYLANCGYDKRSGERGLKGQAKQVLNATRTVYNSIPGRIARSLNDGPFERLEVKLIPVDDKKQEIKVTGKKKVSISRFCVVEMSDCEIALNTMRHSLHLDSATEIEHYPTRPQVFTCPCIFST
jgi:hypothetical protein